MDQLKTLCRFFGIAIALTVTLHAPAHAASARNFERADFNRDGSLTRAEACSGRSVNLCRNFDRIDSNRDGRLTRDEVRFFNRAKPNRRVYRSDKPRRYY